jgi:glycosyltransferase involved in cell wall biosynthesis
MSPDIVAVFAVSEHNNQHLQFAYPGAQIITVHYDIRPEVYQYRPLTKKTPKIACMLKSQNHLYTLYHMIQSRARANLNRGKEYEWIFLKEFSEEQAAETLKQSLIFIFLGVDEGLPRMPLEAMACGCIVIAYGQGPLRECLPMEYQFEPGDLIAPARFLESIMNSYPENLAKYEAIIENGRRMALVYSAERQERSVIDAWEKIMAL